MNFQTRCNRYLQRIHQTQTTDTATPELSLFPHLQTFLEELSADHFGRDTITFTQEPRRLNQIGAPDFVAMDGLLSIGYIEAERSVNFKPAFLTALSGVLELPQVAPFNLPESVSPEEILAYIYAILYSPTYRQRYYDFLKYDFPRIPLPQDIEQFRTLAALGQRLMDWHLLKASRPEVAPTGRRVPAVHRFEGEGDGVVGRVRYVDEKVWINPTQYFTDVPVAVWAYEIGSYRVCEKWLRDRKGEVLRHEDVRRYRAILVAVAETLGVMEAIDGVLWDGV